MFKKHAIFHQQRVSKFNGEPKKAGVFEGQRVSPLRNKVLWATFCCSKYAAQLPFIIKT